MAADQILTTTSRQFDVDQLRSEFPALQQVVHGTKPLVYLDSAATAQKPDVVIDAVSTYYRSINSNVHRGAHALGDASTEAFESAREEVRAFLNAGSASEIVFTRGTTESINLVAQAFTTGVLSPGDEVVVTEMEHHSNFVPWQIACERAGARLRVVPVTDAGELDLVAYEKLLSERTALVALTHVSNTLGTINDVKHVVRLAHRAGAAVAVDGAQSVPHMAVDVADLGCDFYCFSGHKIFGPMGIGVLYGTASWLDRLPPYQSGGSMIANVTIDATTFNNIPYKFEAGTPNVAGAVGLAAALKFVTRVGFDAISNHENLLLSKALSGLSTVDGIRFVGEADHRASVISFLVDGIHPYDMGTLLDQYGIATRTGHHCTEPLMDRFGIPGTVRASFAVYNTMDEVDRLVDGVRQVAGMLR